MTLRSPAGRRAMFLGAALAVAWAPSPAHAEEGEVSLSMGVSGLIWTLPIDDQTSLTRVSPLIHVAARYALDDFWELGGSLSGGLGLGGDAPLEGVGGAFAEVRLLIDALAVVPYLTVGLGALVRGVGPDGYFAEAPPAGEEAPSTLRWDADVNLGLGVDYRPARSWSVGAVARYHILLTDLARTVGPFDLTLWATLYFDP